MDNVISLGVGEPDFDTPWHVRDEGIYSLEKGKTLREVAQFVSEKLAPMDTVLSTKTNFILKKYKDHGTVLAKPEKDERELVN